MTAGGASAEQTHMGKSLHMLFYSTIEDSSRGEE